MTRNFWHREARVIRINRSNSVDNIEGLESSDPFTLASYKVPGLVEWTFLNSIAGTSARLDFEKFNKIK
jgi:hypothetical protein